MGRFDENLDVHGVAAFVERVARDLSHLQPTKIDGGTDVDRAQLTCPQVEERARFVGSDHRRLLESLELSRSLALIRGVDTDVGTREKGVDPRDLRRRHLCSYDPKLCLVGHVVAEFLDHACLDVNPRKILIQFH